MFAVFSLLQGVPTIHKIYVSEETTQKALNNFVMEYIQQGRKEELSLPLSIPISDIKIDTFPSYPVRTYLSIDPSMIEIYEHSLSDKVEKGWVWNGTMKIVESKKIGYFQVLSVSDAVVEDQTEYKTLSSEMDDLIQEIMEEISDTRISLEKDIEDVKKLQFDAQTQIDLSQPILLNSIPYIKIEYPSQPSTKTVAENFDKTKLMSFEEQYLPSPEDKSEGEEEYPIEKQEEDLIETSDNNNHIFQRCRRGSCRSYRSNNGMRKMRLRSY